MWFYLTCYLYMYVQNLDLREHRLVHEGNLVWRLSKKLIDVYVVLFEDIVVLFQKQDDKFVLRCQSAQLVHTGSQDMVAPIIVNNYLMVKQYAAGVFAFFVIYFLHTSIACTINIFFQIRKVCFS